MCIHYSKCKLLCILVTGYVYMYMFSTAQPDDSVTRYAQYLKAFYKRPLPDNNKLLITTSKTYVELALISSENVSREEADGFTRMSVHGQTQEILHKKASIVLEDILKPGENGRPVQRILVEGAPGVGKSTLAWELCHRWEELDNMKQYKLVVLVELRGKRAQEATHLSDLFPLSKNINITQVLDAIGNGEGVLIILDGFDELPREQLQAESIYIQLIKGIEELPKATVIITSQPSVSSYLMKMCKHSIDRRLEILGFTEQKITKYAESVFSDDTKTLKTFLQYIDGNPAIKGMMYLPLNTIFVASIFKHSYTTYSPYPKTMTQLYDAVTRSLIRWHMVNKNLVPSDYHMPQSLQSSEDINSLPKDVAEQLVELAKVAYEGLRDEQYVFTILGNRFDHLGMMKKTLSLDDPATGPKFTFSFLHITLQEYLSALYMSLKLPYTAQVQSHWQSDALPRNSKRFLAGLCKYSINISCQQVGELISPVQNNLLVAQCVYESESIVQENQEIKALFASKEMIHVQGKSLFDYYVIGHCICHHGGVWDVSINEKQQSDLLFQGLKSNIACSGKMQKLTISGDFQTLYPLLGHDDLPLAVSKLQQIHLKGVTFTAESVPKLQEYISHNMVALKTVSIVHCKHNEPLLPILFGPSTLETLSIVNQHISHISIDAMKLLEENTNLKQLELYTSLELPAQRTLCESTSLAYLAHLLSTFIKLVESPIQEFNITLLIENHNNFVYKSVDSKRFDLVISGQPCDNFNITEKLLLSIPEEYRKFVNIKSWLVM